MPASRRAILVLFGTAFAMPALARSPAMSRPTAFAYSFASLDGRTILLAENAGRPILVVNTASLCGYTPQYAGLEHLWQRYRERGLLVVGVPSNDFGNQEPGGATEIAATVHQHYQVSFPVAAKTEVRGPHAHPFYRWAALERPGDGPRWNFHKYLVGRDGRIAASFPSAVDPLDARLIAAIERQLPPR